MGQESEPVRIRTSGSPTRCPFCHADVDRDRDAWVACHACLAPHHAACWRESGACAGCAETRHIAGDVPARTEAPPRLVGRLELELRGARAHFEGDSSVEMHVHPDRSRAFHLVVKNETAAPQRLALGELPRWLNAARSELEAPPGGAVTFELFATQVPEATRPLAARFRIRAPEDAREVAVTAHLAPELVRARNRKRLLLASGLFVLFLLHGGLVAKIREDRMFELAGEGQRTTGHVVRLTPSNHNQTYWEYVVDGVTYERNDFNRGEKLGDPIEITYLPRDPEISVRDGDLASYHPPAWYGLPMIVLAGVAIALVASTLTTGSSRGASSSSSGP